MNGAKPKTSRTVRNLSLRRGASCGFVNLGPALALCEQHHPRLPAMFARIFLNGIGSCFRIYDDRDAEEHISFLEDSYDPRTDGEDLVSNAGP